MDGEEIEFCDGFFDLHTRSCQKITENKGFGMEETRKSMEIVHDIRNKEISILQGDYHPLTKLPMVDHLLNIEI